MPAQRPPPPPGGDQNHGNRIIILQSILLPLATALIVLRLYVRTRIIRALGLDDLSIVVALVRCFIVRSRQSTHDTRSYSVGFSLLSVSSLSNLGKDDMRTILQKPNS